MNTSLRKVVSKGRLRFAGLLFYDMPIDRMYYNPVRSFIWVSNPKCASTSILKQNFKSKERPKSVNVGLHKDKLLEFGIFQEPFPKIRELVKSREKICVIRNPYDRLQSSYLDKIQRQIISKDKRKGLEKIQIVELLNMKHPWVDRHISFDQFVGAITSISPKNLNPHFMPQCLVLKIETFGYDYKIKLENFEFSVKNLNREFNLNFSFPKSK